MKISSNKPIPTPTDSISDTKGMYKEKNKIRSNPLSYDRSWPSKQQKGFNIMDWLVGISLTVMIILFISLVVKISNYRGVNSNDCTCIKTL